MIGTSIGTHTGQGRRDDGRHDASGHGFIDYWCRRVGAHAAGVRAAVTIVARLVILRGSEGHGGHAVGHDDEARFFTGQEFFHHDARTGVTKSMVFKHGARCRARLCVRLRDHHALARSETIGFHHQRHGVRVDIGERRREALEHRIGRGRNAMTLQKLLAVGLRCLEDRAGLPGPETFAPRVFEDIDHTGRERRFRANDGKADIFALR